MTPLDRFKGTARRLFESADRCHDLTPEQRIEFVTGHPDIAELMTNPEVAKAVTKFAADIVRSGAIGADDLIKAMGKRGR